MKKIIKSVLVLLTVVFITNAYSKSSYKSSRILKTYHNCFSIAGENLEEFLHKEVADTPCGAPKGYLTNLALTTTQNSVNGNYTDTTGADGYLAVFSVNIRLDFSPVDGTFYPENTVAGNATVLKSGPNTTISKNGLTPNTYYYLTIFSYKNGTCVGGPRYNLKPSISTFSTKP